MKGKPAKFVAVACALGVVVLLYLPVRAQVAGAIVTGAVTDAQGGAVANAKVSARNVQTSVVTETTTNVDGAYSILNLIPSDYEISASATGFSTSVAKVTLTVGAKQEMNFSLTVGQVTSDGIPIMPSLGMENPDMLGEIIQTLNPPNVIPGCQIVNSRNVAHYLNAACFSMVPQTATNTPYCDTARAATMGVPGFCPNIRGNLARNSVIGPGLADVDFSVVKNNRISRISESFNVQFRAEFFNALNRANFAPPTLSPNTGVGAMEAILNSGQPNSQFGQLTLTQTPNRQIQLALKLIW